MQGTRLLLEEDEIRSLQIGERLRHEVGVLEHEQLQIQERPRRRMASEAVDVTRAAQVVPSIQGAAVQDAVDRLGNLSSLHPLRILSREEAESAHERHYERGRDHCGECPDLSP